MTLIFVHAIPNVGIGLFTQIDHPIDGEWQFWCTSKMNSANIILDMTLIKGPKKSLWNTSPFIFLLKHMRIYSRDKSFDVIQGEFSDQMLPLYTIRK